MATYTIRLIDVIKLVGFNNVKAWFMDYELSDFLLPEQLDLVLKTPIWSKEKLAEKIINHYYMREIGFETIELFSHFVRISMKEIMEAKLPLIYTTALEYDPLINVDFKETFERNATGTGTSKGISNSNSNSNSSGISLNNDTPQTNVSKDDIFSGRYTSSTNGSETNSNANDETSSSSEVSNQNSENYVKHMVGNSGVSATYQAMIKQFRQNIVNVDKDIIEELNSLFMSIY